VALGRRAPLDEPPVVGPGRRRRRRRRGAVDGGEVDLCGEGGERRDEGLLDLQLHLLKQEEHEGEDLRRPRRITHSALDDRHMDARRQRHRLELAHARAQRRGADEHDRQLRLDHLVVEAQLGDDEVGARVQ